MMLFDIILMTVALFVATTATASGLTHHTHYKVHFYETMDDLESGNVAETLDENLTYGLSQDAPFIMDMFLPARQDQRQRDKDNLKRRIDGSIERGKITINEDFLNHYTDITWFKSLTSDETSIYPMVILNVKADAQYCGIMKTDQTVDSFMMQKRYLWFVKLEHVQYRYIGYNPETRNMHEKNTEHRVPRFFHTPWIVQMDNTVIIKELGSGDEGTVYLATTTISRGESRPLYAVKVPKKTYVNDDNEYTKWAAIYSSKTNPDHRETFLHKPLGADGSSIFSEFCPGGDLYRQLSRMSSDGCLSEHETRFYMRQLVPGIELIHKRGYLHLDLKLGNLLLDWRGYLKIADFGISKTHEEMADIPGATDMDWYCAGIIMYTLLMGKTANANNLRYIIDFRGSSGEEDMKRALYHLPGNFSAHTQSFLYTLLFPGNRTGISMHDFLTQGGEDPDFLERLFAGQEQCPILDWIPKEFLRQNENASTFRKEAADEKYDPSLAATPDQSVQALNTKVQGKRDDASGSDAASRLC